MLELAETDNKQLDLLDRQEFVDQMLTVATSLSEKKKNACYAINGDWGVGKTFVLDMFEKQAEIIGKEDEELSRFLIFRYNCWEYDYYEEPLVAIVASILDQIDEKLNLLNSDTKTRVVAILKAVSKGLLQIGVQIVKEKTGIDAEALYETVKDSVSSLKDDIKEAHEYDQHFDFKKNLKKLKELIASLSADQSLIFIVDELDRCLPEYTIKVLERLHHLFDGIPNVQVILSIDVRQLEHAVCQIYGAESDVKNYLRKFISFEIKLDPGIIKDHFAERFKYYSQHFEIQSRYTNAIEVDQFKSYILDGIDMRHRISIIERCDLIHSLLFSGEKEDARYMCLEMLLVILKDCEINTEHAKTTFNIHTVFDRGSLWVQPNNKSVPAGLKRLSEYYRINRVTENSNYQVFFYHKDDNRYVIETTNVRGALLSVYRAILGFDNDLYGVDNKRLVEYGCKFWDYLQIIS